MYIHRWPDPLRILNPCRRLRLPVSRSVNILVKCNYRDATPEEMDRVARIQAVCKTHGTPLAAAALQFPLAHPIVASIIPGAFSPDQVRQNVDHCRHPIPASLWSDLKSQGLIAHDAPTP